MEIKPDKTSPPQEFFMPSKYCSNCQAIRSMRVSVYKREKINPDGDKIQIETTSFHCEDCNSFIDSEDVIVNAFRNAKVDRRKKDDSTTEKRDYNGPERRSGKERRIWVNRLQESMLNT
jgi:hypothetical protein